MARPKSDKPPKTQISIKLDPEVLKDLEDIVYVAYSDRTKIAQICLKLGMEAFLKAEPEIAKKLNHYRKTGNLYKLL